MAVLPRWIRSKWMVPGVLVVALSIQLIPVNRSNPPVRSEVIASDTIKALLRRACYDCHSNETKWPWYSRVAPVSWLVAHDVEEGRENVNFTDWPTFDLDAQEHAFDEMWEQISERKMPLKSYLLLHPEARLTDAEREALLRWIRP